MVFKGEGNRYRWQRVEWKAKGRVQANGSRQIVKRDADYAQ